LMKLSRKANVNCFDVHVIPCLCHGFAHLPA
jgi:hypothetical protein